MKHGRYKHARKIYRIGYIAAFIIMLLLAFLTYYGQYSGNFVMTVDEQAYDRGISVSEDPNFETYARWLTADAVEEVREITLNQIEGFDLGRILTTNGSFRESLIYGASARLNYLAYTFYLKNVGRYETNVGYEVVIEEVTGMLASAIRIMIIEDGYIEQSQVNVTRLSTLKEGSYKLYQAPDTIEKDYYTELATYREFVSDTVICSEQIKNLGADQMKKFTILMWLEGEDPDCVYENVDYIYGSKIKIAMNFFLL